MLVIDVRLDDKIIIDNNIEILVTAIRKGHAKLSFDAPKEVIIKRVKFNVDEEIEDSCMG